jgi:hypothetical protein
LLTLLLSVLSLFLFRSLPLSLLSLSLSQRYPEERAMHQEHPRRSRCLRKNELAFHSSLCIPLRSLPLSLSLFIPLSLDFSFLIISLSLLSISLSISCISLYICPSLSHTPTHTLSLLHDESSSHSISDGPNSPK